jgi:signal transduction histidine kinase/CheY-like chemotaxis protein
VTTIAQGPDAEGAFASPLESFSRELRRVDSYDQLIALIQKELHARLGLTNAWLYVSEHEDDSEFTLVATAGSKATEIRELVPVVPRAGDQMIEELLEDRGPVIIPDAQLGPFPEITRRLGNRTVVNLPMVVVDHSLGLLGAGTFGAEGTVPISAQAARYLVQLSDITSVSLARLVLKRRSLERSELERRLAQRHRLESLGLLAGGVAHDFNNLLTVVRMSVEVLGQSPLSDAQRADLAMIGDAERSASKLTQKLLTLGRKQPASPESLDINEGVETFNRLLSRLLPASIQIDFIAGAGLPKVSLDPGQLEQVLMNLALNARDSMPRGGRLTIETQQVLVNGDYRRAHPWAKPGRYVLLTVSDSGNGMPPDVAYGDGTGLGLAVVWSIVNQHGGMIHCYSEVNLGTAFKVYFPAAEQAASKVGSKLLGPVPKGTERILVADDQPHVLFVVRRALEGAGYRVTTAPDGAAALEAARAASFDLFLLDAVMPGLSGRDVCERLREEHPGARFLFASGYGAEALPAAFLTDMGYRMVPKPLDPDTLLRAVREALDGPPKR